LPDVRAESLRPASWRDVAAVAWPAALAAIVTPLLGVIDTAVLTRGASMEALAGASLAAAVFSIVYWTFGFLRMSLSGLTAQALGAGDEVRLRSQLAQGLALGIGIGVLLVLLAVPIGWAASRILIEGSEASKAAGEAMRTYIAIRILAAPASLGTTAILGWLTGQARTGLLSVVTIGTALINAGLSILFVLVQDKGVGGLAAATALAETAGFILAVGSVLLILRGRGGIAAGWEKAALTRGLGAVLSLNRDIFLRTAVLTFVFASFARFGAGFGDRTVAANHVLINLALTATMLLDGTAIAAETFVGQAVGAKERRKELFEAAWRRSSELAMGLAVLLTLGLVLFGRELVAMTIGEGPDAAAVLDEAQRFLPWLVLSPLVFAPAFQLDGIFIGATRGRALRNAMLAAGAVYGVAVLTLPQAFGNHGLWLALFVFMGARGAALLPGWRGLKLDLAQ
jgi:MATE family multidrug resistance protein